MTETERLRKLLDERGAEWYDDDRGVVIGVDEPTTVASFKDYDGLLIGMMCICCTAERAVEATLGRPTCRLEREPDSDRLWWCSNCQSYHEHVSEFPWEYCPRCGAKVVG